MNGWIKQHRKILKWEWFTYPGAFLLFSTLLLLANHKDQSWQGVTIKRGQVATGRKRLSTLTGLTEQNIRTILEHLKSTNELTIKSTNRFSIITITNWDTYQMTDQETNQQPNQQTNQQVTNRGNHKQEVKDLKNVKKVKNIFITEFVKMQPGEKEKLIEKYGAEKMEDMIERLHNFIGSTGRQYKSHYHTICMWMQKEPKQMKTTKDIFDD